ncbi:small-conductance mechanosensitive channel [Bernardetia litoralis DSM 6794]|uniref:Small-conductance mechanosensitive channel n=1 Tax=Bernardetia litoralis (strain ATCC 23117 / DSM 6794 / NBRC 15988 / NCIMB 1366 / Fx l1 / Sio-4) TaxID=880071 RepID=I4AJ69_BERLS|nr:mechanosensitive ion channel domain-containing protein [Bernardetia litoralis]AFM04004.1 small-conductance mechanosensitive channel [Bernardetia litoralis DSM 6794]
MIDKIIPFDSGLLLTIILILIVAGITSRLAKSAINKHLRNIADSEESKDYDNATRLRFLKNGVNFIIFIVALLLITYTIPSLRALAVTLFAGAGIFAAFIAFASQKAFSNIVSGIFIVWFKPFRVGDIVVVGTYFGIVEDITLRHTVIKGLENKRIIIPNSNISSDVIVNSTIEDPTIQRFVEIWINYDSDLKKAMAIMEDESMKHPLMIDGRTLEEKIKGEPIVLVRTTGMDERGIKIRATVWAKDLSTSFDMYCDLIRDIKYRFDKEGIKIGVPHRHLSQTFNQEIEATSLEQKINPDGSKKQ